MPAEITPALKRQALALFIQGRTPSWVAGHLQLSRSTMFAWRRQARNKATDGLLNTANNMEELASRIKDKDASETLKVEARNLRAYVRLV